MGENLASKYLSARGGRSGKKLHCHRATSDDTRNLCTTICKWTYLGHAHLQQMSSQDSVAMQACGWDDLFWQEIGLGDLVDGGYATIGIGLLLLNS